MSPTFWLQAGGEVAADDQSSFTMYNPQLTLFGVPLSVAESVDADKIAFVVIDVPQATETLDADVARFAGAADLAYEIVTIPPGTADMTPQMQDVAASGADVVQVVGNDAFCIAAFNGLTTAGYEGEITSITQCITDATREGVPAEVLEGISITSTIALGATDDPTFQLYAAVMEEYGDDVREVDNATSMGGYVAMASLLTALDGMSGEITHQTVIDTIKAMPEAELPGGGGMTFQCGGSASAGAARRVHQPVPAHHARRRRPPRRLRGRRLHRARLGIGVTEPTGTRNSDRGARHEPAGHASQQFGGERAVCSRTSPRTSGDRRAGSRRHQPSAGCDHLVRSERDGRSRPLGGHRSG